MRRQSSKPELPGSITSSSTQSTGRSSSSSTAAAASPAVRTSKPATPRKSRSRATMSGSSSTTRTVGSIEGGVWRTRRPRVRGFRRLFGARAPPARLALVTSRSLSNDERNFGMRRLPTMLASASAAALATLAITVAVPAIADNAGGGKSGDKFPSCLARTVRAEEGHRRGHRAAWPVRAGAALVPDQARRHAPRRRWPGAEELAPGARRRRGQPRGDEGLPLRSPPARSPRPDRAPPRRARSGRRSAAGKPQATD